MPGTANKLRELADLNGWITDVDPLGVLHGRYGDRVLYVEFGQTGHVGYAYTRIQPEHSHEIPTDVEAVRPTDSGRAGVVFDWITKYGKYGQPGGNQYTVTYELNDVEYDGVIRQWETAVLTLPEKSRTAARASLLAHDVPVRIVHDVQPHETAVPVFHPATPGRPAQLTDDDIITQYAVRWVSDSGEIATYECPDQADAEDFLRHLQKARTHPGANPRIVTRTITPWKDPLQ